MNEKKIMLYVFIVLAIALIFFLVWTYTYYEKYGELIYSNPCELCKKAGYSCLRLIEK
jgi:hypothetical protein